MISAQHLTYSVNGCRLTDDVSFDLPGGEIVAILGANGAGKSTLLRQLTGYLQPDSGHCSLFGKPLTAWSTAELARTRAVMRQSSGMSFPFTTTEVIRMGQHSQRSHHLQDQLIIIMTLCDCMGLAKRDYRSLSGGEQQRVQLARLLWQLWQPEPAPKWLFLDEPTSALDIHHQQRLFRLLRRLTGEWQLNVCCVLHDLNLAARYADRIILLEKGRMLAHGTPQEVLTEQTLNALYHAEVTVLNDPVHNVPLIMLDP